MLNSAGIELVLARLLLCGTHGPMRSAGQVMRTVAGIDTEAAIGEFEKEILAYLAARPHARDSVEGVAKSWLSLGAVLIPFVQGALDRLVNRGELAKATLIDGTVIYHLPQSASDDDISPGFRGEQR